MRRVSLGMPLPVSSTPPAAAARVHTGLPDHAKFHVKVATLALRICARLTPSATPRVAGL